jgi:hypothetical protein
VEVKEVFMQCKVIVTTEVQSPWPNLMVQQIQQHIKNKCLVAQETTLVMWLEPWQIKLMQSDEWVTETCAWLRSSSGMTLKDIRVEVCNLLLSRD